MASKRAKAALSSGLGLVALTVTYLTIPWEGVETTAYYDRLGRVWTVCAGETLNVKKGDQYTKAQCLGMLEKRIELDYRRPLQRCVKGFDQAPISVQAAMLDLTYNVGVGAGCRSSVARHITAKRYSEACSAMTLFNRAGGKVVEGLVRRRTDGDSKRIGERELCLAGLGTVPVPRPSPVPAPRTMDRSFWSWLFS